MPNPPRVTLTAFADLDDNDSFAEVDRAGRDERMAHAYRASAFTFPMTRPLI